MALITKIREKSWLLPTIMAIALVGMIIMFMMQDANFGGGSRSTTMGKIAGQEISANEFNRREQLLYGNSAGDIYGRRNTIWNYFVENALVKKAAESMGLGVSKAELSDLEFGQNPSPVVSQMFGDGSGAINREQLNNFKKALDANQLQPEQLQYWQEKEKEIVKERLQEKLSNAVSKGMYTPSWLADLMVAENNDQLSLNVVKVPLEEVEDNSIKLTDADYENYIAENKGKLMQDEETRKVDYLMFNVIPTAADSAKMREQALTLRNDFVASTNDSIFIESNQGNMTWYQPKSKVESAVKDTFFKVPVGTIVGPYLDNSGYMLAKVLERRTMPDSVQVRHILISNNEKVRKDSVAMQLADSLLNVIKTGGDFAALAKQYSDDPGSKDKGGEYTWGNDATLYPEYYDYTFKTGKAGEYKIVKTQAGGYHIMQIMKYKGASANVVRLGYIRQAIAPSDDTQNKIEEIASNFMNSNRNVEDLRKAAKAKGLEIVTTNPLKANDFSIGGAFEQGQTARSIVKWAFENSVGDVSPELYEFTNPQDLYTEKYVVAALRSIQPKGLPSVADIKDDITPAVKRKKKSEYLASQIKTSDLNAIANQYHSKVDTVVGVTYLQGGRGLDFDPKLLAAAYNTPLNAVSKPIAGENGVYVLKVVEKSTNPNPLMNADMMRQQMNMSIRGQARSRFIQSLRKNADITDNRSTFF